MTCYFDTEENLSRDPRIQLLVASRRVEGGQAPGQGFVLKGTASLLTDGEHVERVKAHFPWARGVLVVTVQEAEAHL